MSLKGCVLACIAKETIQLDQDRVILFVAPGVASILKCNLLEFASVEGFFENSHLPAVPYPYPASQAATGSMTMAWSQPYYKWIEILSCLWKGKFLGPAKIIYILLCLRLHLEQL